VTAVVWLLTLVVAVLALLVVGLLRSHATILRALHDAGIDLDPDRPATHDPVIRTVEGVPGPAGTTGQRAADIVGTTPGGGARSISVTVGPPTLLAFLTAGCSTCANFWSAFAAGVDLPPDVRLVVVAKGPELESPSAIAELAPEGVLTIQSTAAWDDYRIPVAPYFVLVDGTRGVVVGEGAAATWDRVRALLARALADAGLAEGSVRRRDLLSGRVRRERIDRDLLDAGLAPGDPRLFHQPSDDV
jgi:hypothetical protein